MIRSIRRLAATLAVAGLLAAPGSAFAGDLMETTVDSQPASPMVDVFIMRPFGLLGLAASAVLWIPAQAVTMAVRPSEWEKPIDYMLREPYEFVFVDPIGTH